MGAARKPTLLQKREAFVRAFERELGPAGRRAAMAAWDVLYGDEETAQHAARAAPVLVSDATEEERARVRAKIAKVK